MVSLENIIRAKFLYINFYKLLYKPFSRYDLEQLRALLVRQLDISSKTTNALKKTQGVLRYTTKDFSWNLNIKYTLNKITPKNHKVGGFPNTYLDLHAQVQNNA